MSNTDISVRLATLNAQILALETERAALLREQLAASDARRDEIMSFIGLFSASSGTPVTASPPVPKNPRAGKKTKGRGRKRSARGRAASGKRLESAIDAVKAAGKAGISAKKLAESTGIPYSAVRKMITDGVFRQVGEKRNSRLFVA